MRKKLSKTALAALSFGILSLASSALVRADDTPNDISSASSKYSSTSVFVGGTPIMRVRFAAGGYTPEQRADAIQMRVNKLLGQGPIKPEDITVQDMGVDSAVFVKGQLLFTADAATAQYNQSSAHALAVKWADNMRETLPDLTRPQ